MPELPEVETIRRGLERRILCKEIVRVLVRKVKLVRGDGEEFCAELIGREFAQIGRVGKLLILEIGQGKNDGKKFLLIHLKMTGQLIYCDGRDFVAGGHANSRDEQEKLQAGDSEEFCQEGKYTHIVFEFAGGGRLFYNDMRQFGFLQIVPAEELAQIKSGYGIEPGTDNFTLCNFAQIFLRRKTNVKALLLNQKVISGLGNIYVDEVLFAAGVLPSRSANSLTEAEQKKIFRFIKSIIAQAIRSGGTTFSDFVGADGKQGNFAQKLKVYGRAGEICPKCKTTKIQKTKLVGRGTHFCANCQK